MAERSRDCWIGAIRVSIYKHFHSLREGVSHSGDTSYHFDPPKLVTWSGFLKDSLLSDSSSSVCQEDDRAPSFLLGRVGRQQDDFSQLFDKGGEG